MLWPIPTGLPNGHTERPAALGRSAPA